MKFCLKRKTTITTWKKCLYYEEQKTPKQSLITVEIKNETIKTALGKNKNR